MISTICPRCTGPTFDDLTLATYGMCHTCEHLVESDLAYARRKVTDLYDWDCITAGQRDRLLDVLADTTKAFTADRKPIRIGGHYIDYDLNPTVITGIAAIDVDHRETNGAAIWWRTTTGMFDGSRLATRRPR